MSSCQAIRNQTVDCTQCDTFTLPIPDKVAKVFIGIFSGYAVFQLNLWTSRPIEEFCSRITTANFGSQDIYQLLNFAEGLSTPLLRTALKIVLYGFAIVLGPILEERLFRGQIYKMTEKYLGDRNSTPYKILTIVGNGLLFGACHLSPFQGMANIPIFLTTSMLGCCFAALREATGDTVAPIAAHITHNALALSYYIRA
jgi:membrane protease YdiL (CAAX protease family)